MIVPAAKLRYIDRPAYGPFAAPYIAIDLNGARAADVEALSDLPCPVLGIGDSAGAAARLCDVVVNAPMHLASVIANIEAAPMTAMTLVQTLRATERLEVPAALIVESLAYAALQGGAENRAWLAARAEPEITAPGSEKPLWVERSADALTLTLNRPQARNAIDVALRDALCEALSLAAIDRTIGEIHVRGNGKCFSTGGALAEFGTVSDQATAHAIRMAASPAIHLAAVAGRATAHLHGACIGAGAELAALCG
jgi:hypothetical protein